MFTFVQTPFMYGFFSFIFYSENIERNVWLNEWLNEWMNEKKDDEIRVENKN